MKLPYILSAILSLPINLFANTIDVTADISTNTTWVSSNQYILKDYIFVTPGASLTIEAGTIIKADQALVTKFLQPEFQKCNGQHPVL